jgi:hypothetical protein
VCTFKFLIKGAVAPGFNGTRDRTMIVDWRALLTPYWTSALQTG